MSAPVSPSEGGLIELKAPAKINLGLRVVGRRADGYHLLESVFAPLELADDLRVAIRSSDRSDVRLALEDPLGRLDHDADPERNLAVRAARAFLEEASADRAIVEIELVKRIPVGAGLGGGSSDAGAVLRALRALMPGALTPPRLAEMALALGADVPFFLDPRPAWVAGIGEEITPFDTLPPLHLLVVTPSPPLATAEVFRRFSMRNPKLTSTPPRFRIRAAREKRADALRAVLGTDLPARSDRSGGCEERAGTIEEEPLHNDLEAVAVELRPEIGELRDRLRALGAQAAAMSGSGPSVYGVFPDREAAGAAASEARGGRPETQVHVSGTLP